MNLLDQFVLVNTQVTRLQAELTQVVSANQAFQAKVELKLTPRPMPEPATTGQYQVEARLNVRGLSEQQASAENPAEEAPLFQVELVLQAAYQQFRGEAVTFETFSQHHGSLTRQLFPIIHHQLQPIFKQFGLDKLRLPHDLAQHAEPSAADGAPQPRLH
jgi:hypothetical protein